MKKIALSAFVVLTFIIYGLHQQSEESEAHVVVPSVNRSSNSPSNSSGNSSPSSNTPTIGSTLNSSNNSDSSGQYKDGTYTGDPVNFFYGTMQVKAVIHGGQIADVQFLKYPDDRSTSVMINQQAIPYLKQEAIQTQSANVNIISGATDSTQAFQQTLSSALAQAR